MTDKPARKRGRPAYEPTALEREQCRQLAALLGAKLADIALVLHLSVPTLRKYFREEIREGAVKANAAVAQSLYRQATDAKKPNAIVGIFWMKCRAGWVDNPHARAGSRGGGRAPARLGKKEQALAEASQAQEGTEWDDLLPDPRRPTLQ